MIGVSREDFPPTANEIVAVVEDDASRRRSLDDDDTSDDDWASSGKGPLKDPFNLEWHEARRRRRNKVLQSNSFRQMSQINELKLFPPTPSDFPTSTLPGVPGVDEPIRRRRVGRIEGLVNLVKVLPVQEQAALVLLVLLVLLSGPLMSR